jgi:hypothetical protein
MNREDKAVKIANDKRLAALADPSLPKVDIYEWQSAKNGSWPLFQNATVTEYSETDGTWLVRYHARDGYPMVEYRRLPPT